MIADGISLRNERVYLQGDLEASSWSRYRLESWQHCHTCMLTIPRWWNISDSPSSLLDDIKFRPWSMLYKMYFSTRVANLMDVFTGRRERLAESFNYNLETFQVTLDWQCSNLNGCSLCCCFSFLMENQGQRELKTTRRVYGVLVFMKCSKGLSGTLCYLAAW